jgi:glycosyltransferase involved in cell wall biosynthesis
MFAGRIEEDKGVFDLLAIAQELQATSEGSFEFTICGDGSALAALRQQIDHLGLQGLVKVYGRLDRADLVARYLESHVVIVPTRTSFAEGYALVVAEAILMLRPVVTCSVVPAAEMLSAAVILASPNDVLSYVSCIEALSKNAEMYLQLVENARRLRPEILDNSASFLVILRSSGI